MFRTNELHSHCKRGHLHIEVEPQKMTFRKGKFGEEYIQSVCEYCKIPVWLTPSQFRELYKEYTENYQS